MRIMKFAIRKDHLLFMSLMCVAVLGHTGSPVFSIRAASPESSVAYHVRFGKEDFIRFYSCLLTFKTCLVTYTERYYQSSNILLVRGDHKRPLQPGKQQHSPVTSFCTRTKTGELSCTDEHHHHTDGYPRFGIGPLRNCDAQLCPCIYFYNAGHISYDSIPVQDCPIKRLENTSSKLIRRRRASRSSSKSSSRSRSRTSSISSSSSNNSGGGGGGSPCAAMIAGITVGVIVFVGITLCIIFYCIKKHGDNKKEKIDNTMAESPNDISEEIAAGNWNNGSDFPMPDVTNDTGVLKHDGEDVFPH